MTQLENRDYITLKRSVYREYSRAYDDDRERFVSGTALTERIDWALEPLQPGESLLDLGCGSGRLLRQAPDRSGGNGLLIGLDLTPDMLALSKLELGRDVTLVEGIAATGLPFKDSSFDLVTNLNLVQELPTEAVPSLFGGVHRLLRPGARSGPSFPAWLKRTRPPICFARCRRSTGPWISGTWMTSRSC